MCLTRDLKLDQLLVLLIGNVVGEQDAVDKQAQLAVGELALEVEVGEDHVLLLVTVLVAEHADALAVIDVIPELDQVHQISLDRFSVELHVILALEDFLYLLLAQAMVLVRVAFEDVEDIHDSQLLRLLLVHQLTPSVNYCRKARFPFSATSSASSNRYLHRSFCCVLCGIRITSFSYRKCSAASQCSS